MAQNVASPDTKELPLSTFGGLVTYINPLDLPAGVSPLCVDVTFLPGGVSQRPCLRRVFTTPLGSATITYGKTYIDPKGVIRDLYLDSLGNLWVENVTTGSLPQVLMVTTPSCYAKSVTAFGREYLAISDSHHGQEIPLQYDGTFLDRVSQDGPGAPPVVTNLIIPPVAMLGPAAPPTLTITGIFPTNQQPGGYFIAIGVFFSATPPDLDPGTQVLISGTGTGFDGGPYTVLGNQSDGSIQLSAYFPAGTAPYLGGGTFTIGSGVANTTMVRQANQVTVYCTAAHQLQIGYQAQISGVTAETIGTISTIVIKNADQPGIATVTMTTPHGLVPGLQVSLQGIAGASVGGGIASIVRAGQVVTVTTNSAHGLSPGGVVTIAGVTTTNFNTTAVVANVVSATVFTFNQADIDASDTTGTITLDWPIPNTPTPTYFAVISAPSATTFQIQINYSDGSWSGGTVLYAWDGTFFVSGIASATVFQYQQYGPNDSTTSVGKVTPFGQVAPGKKQCRVSFLTRQGYVTAASPPFTLVANGGQYLSVTDMPIGPPNVVARLLQFTSAYGAYFYYIPSPPQANGQIVGTQTQINDNTTTAVVLDFSDATLFAALGTSIQGNNLANQIVIDSALGFGFYGDRLLTYGQRNAIDNLLNLGFDGGYQSSNPTIPTGWTAAGVGAGGGLAPGHYGLGWLNGGAGSIYQSFYEDYSGAPIATGNTQYTFRAWIQNGTATATISSASTGFSATVTINGSGTGSWQQSDFSAAMPSVIPSDMILSISGTGTSLLDEISIIFTATPFLNGLFASYVNNPEAFDAVTGLFGPKDTHPVLDLGIIRGILYMLTQDPNGRLHETSIGNTEPAQWAVNEVAANCGTVSPFSLTRSQADDSSAAGGEEWFSWFSSTGIRIFGGQDPDKISQEIQRPQGLTFPGAPADLGALNVAARSTVWGLNDPAQKVMWFGIPTGNATAPSILYFVSYLGLDSASAIAAGAPVHRALSGKLVANDLSRKWSPWLRTLNGAALMLRGDGNLQPVFFAGNGSFPGAGGFGNVYTLDPTLYTDQDYGQISPTYTTYSFPDREQEQQLQLGGHMKMLSYLHTYIAGVGIVTISILPGSLTGAWPIAGVYPLQAVPGFMLEFGGGQCQSQDFFFQYTFAPNGGTDIAFSLSSIIPAMKPAKRLAVRGVYP